MGTGEEGPLCDPGSELLLFRRERESSARILNGVEKKRTPTDTVVEVYRNMAVATKSKIAGPLRAAALFANLAVPT